MVAAGGTNGCKLCVRATDQVMGGDSMRASSTPISYGTVGAVTRDVVVVLAAGGGTPTQAKVPKAYRDQGLQTTHYSDQRKRQIEYK